MSNIVRDAIEAANWVATALRSSGYNADFSPQSLSEVDRFFEENSSNGVPLPGGLLSANLGPRMFAIGAYVGEVIRRSKQGQWRGDDTDPRAEINIEVLLPDGTRFWPVQRVMKRLKSGLADGIEVYGAAMGLDVR
ncbi:hypothetical protein [Polyangium sp. 6x1]|uniref:hypothetical protein n=1 Tax=Polyangium sp. 6x1 TaxID=3042689 RepID=UPI0024823C13|nr:hypothetical protein [Polyangium sp. 6x1]MDI1451766.1 hypothetical protein [Polyangium sp. 6x1]